MTPDTTAAPKHGRRLARLALALLLAGLTAGAGWWWWRAAPAAPPMPPGVEDREVLRVLERTRQKVLEQPRSGEAWGCFGLVLLGNLFDREADRCFVEAARLDRTDPRWPYARALIALKRAPDNAVSLLRQAVAVADASPEYRSAVRFQLAEALLERGGLDEAEALFREEEAREPGNPRAALGLGLTALARGDRQAARGPLTAARSSPHARKTATAQLAALARGRGDLTAAVAYEKEAGELPEGPPWPDPLLDRVVEMQAGRRGRERAAALLEKEHRFGEAAQVYLDRLEEERTARACIGAGLNLARLRDYARALPLLREGVKLAPDNAQAHYALALALFSQAEKDWQHSPGSPRLQASFHEAVQHAQRATELRPDHAAAYLTWGLALKYLGQPAAAVAPLRKGVACRPADFELQLGLGEALLEVGNFPEAQMHLENARRLDAEDPRPAQALARLRRKKG